MRWYFLETQPGFVSEISSILTNMGCSILSLYSYSPWKLVSIGRSRNVTSSITYILYPIPEKKFGLGRNAIHNIFIMIAGSLSLVKNATFGLFMSRLTRLHFI
jgi:hypothetical protein